MTEKISVVIPSYNGQKLLEKHLPNVVKILDAGDEIVISDDASTDNTVSWIKQQIPKYRQLGIDLRCESNQINQRFGITANRGVRAAKNNLVLLLNNDVSPLNDLKKFLLPWFDQPDFFAVGCAEVKENTPTAQIYGRGTGGWQKGLLVHWYDPHQNSSQTLWTAGGSMLVARDKFLQLDGFDPLFAPAYEEDRDLSYRALKRGWRIAFEPRARVWHQHETTNTTVFGQRQIQVISWKNQFILVWKNVSHFSWLAQHLLFLPYHLVITNWRSGWTLGLGFWQALLVLHKIISKRREQQSDWVKTDPEIISSTA